MSGRLAWHNPWDVNVQNLPRLLESLIVVKSIWFRMMIFWLNIVRSFRILLERYMSI